MKYYLLSLITIFLVSLLPAQNDVKGSIELVENFGDTVRFVKKEKNKILPIALPVTEPAVGYGLIGGMLYFIPKKNKKHTADMAAAVAGITSNGTWLAGGGYLGYWKEDKLKYSGFAGYGHINLDYYGFGGKPISFSQDAAFLMQQLKFRIRDSKYYLGGRLQISKITISNENEIFKPNELWNNGLGLIAEYDNLNNFLSPTKGLKVHAGYDQFPEFMGGKTDWGRFELYSHWYIDAGEKWVPAFRFEFLSATGDPPFYAYPYISLRGIPALRYQAESTILVETEQLYNFSPRWGVVGFTGIGSTLSSVEKDINNEVVWNAGAGIRFMALKSMGVKVGTDIARGPEEWAFYVSVGSAW
jgi:hypothetical protein